MDQVIINYLSLLTFILLVFSLRFDFSLKITFSLIFVLISLTSVHWHRSFPQSCISIEDTLKSKDTSVKDLFDTII